MEELLWWSVRECAGFVFLVLASIFGEMVGLCDPSWFFTWPTALLPAANSRCFYHSRFFCSGATLPFGLSF